MLQKRKILLMLATGLLMTACGDSEKQLKERAAELCKYIPDHELLEQSRDYMTEDFYAVLDTMFNRLPNHEAMDHEWLYYFVTGNGGTIADYEVVGIEMIDKNHAVATISVRQKWKDGSFDKSSDIEEHRLEMENMNGQWLMADFDGHKADCIRHIAINRKEQAVRKAISDYLVSEISEHYLKGELCIPVLMMVHEDSLQVWGDFWVLWYNPSGDTLKCVSGGNHSGLMTLEKIDGNYKVLSFEQTVDGAGNQASARRIFGEHYDIYQNMHSNEAVREAIRKEQLGEYVQFHGLLFHYYQDYGWPAVEL
ncbi:MAG: hypothetical protein IJR04_01720 [Bacteroidales bacterium]|nr:hypothetical protein [Bacteroidales bacterium]